MLDYRSISCIRRIETTLGLGEVDRNVLAPMSGNILGKMPLSCNRARQKIAGRSGEDMNKLKFSNSKNVEGGLSQRSGSFTKRFLAMTGSAALIVGGVGSVFIGATAASATTTVSSANYIVGSQVSGVTLSQSSLATSTSSVNTLGFTATDGIAASGSATLTLTAGTAGDAPFSGTNPTTAIVTSGGSSAVAAVAYTAAGSTSKTSTVLFTLPSTFSVANGAAVTFQFTATNGSTGDTFTPSVVTSSDPVPASGTAYTLVAPVSTNITSSLSTSANGASATLKLGSIYLADTTSTVAKQGVFPSATTNQGVITLSYPNGTLPASASDYTITATNSSGVVTTLTSSSFAVGVSGSVATITLNTGVQIAAGDVVSIAVAGVINPASGTTSTTPTIGASETGTSANTWVINSTSTYSSTAASVSPVTLGSPTAITALSITPGSPAANATTSYAVNFKATTALTTTEFVNVSLASGTVLGTSAYVVDSTSGMSGTATVAPGTGSAANAGTVSVPFAINAGDSVTVTLIGVTNPSVGGSDTGTVSTSTDSVNVSASYSTTSATTTTLTPVVTLSNTATGGSSTYTITDISAAAAYATGSTTGQIGLYFPSATGLPTATSDYSITDLTNSTGTGAPATVTVDTSTVSGDTGVVLTVGNAISMNDQLKIVITGVINPTVGNTYNAQFTGVNGSTQAVVPALPSAGMTYPNGAFVQSGGQIDVIAGGYGFGISSPAAYAQLAAMNASTVVAGTFPAAMAPRAGTLIQVAGSPGIWVVGTNGQIYQFSSVSQFLADGYSPMQVVEVPSSGGLTVGAGAPPTAATTMADGSIQNFGGTLYVFAGGVAFGIPTPAAAASIMTATGATPILGSGSVPTATVPVNGTLLQTIGSTTTYVVSGGVAIAPTSSSVFTSGGYTSAYAVLVNGLGSLPTA